MSGRYVDVLQTSDSFEKERIIGVLPLSVIRLRKRSASADDIYSSMIYQGRFLLLLNEDQVYVRY